MSAPVSGHVTVTHRAGEIDLAYLSWGDAGASRTAVCVHGVSRNAHDFRWLGPVLAEAGWRVLAFDMAGRGASAWLDDPADYTVPTYVAHVGQVMVRLGLRDVDWIGTSMGGLIGIVMAASGVPLRRMVLNDIGPFISAEALGGIRQAVAQDRTFGSVREVEEYLKARFAPYGPVTEEQWAVLAAHGVRRDDKGQLRLHYDPAIAVPMHAAAPKAVDLWAMWDRIAVPTLALRGGASTLLDQATAETMTQRGPKASLFTFHGIGHPLWLADGEQIHLVRDWLLGHPDGDDGPAL